MTVVVAAFVLAPISAGHAADGRAIVLNGSASGAQHCESCHGLTGQGIPANGYPRLAGLDADYLVHQLNSFADGSRASSMMSPVAKGLSPEDRRAVADYYARQSPPQVTDQAADSPEAATRGRALATVGMGAKGLPACNQCHGPNGEGVGDAFPRLAGQS
ncbi:cytochrome c, partial [Rhodopseudomonas sp. B29]|uniref:c-type cytochrome n=1 Tax=Rhodopseudomonas sp. B29 TaxID=95607 RepID=UPI0003B58192